MGLSDNMVPQKSINMVYYHLLHQNRHSAVFPMFWQTRMRKWARNKRVLADVTSNKKNVHLACKNLDPAKYVCWMKFDVQQLNMECLIQPPEN